MRIGGQEANVNARAYGARRNEATPQVGIEDNSGLGAVAQALDAVGGLTANWATFRAQEEVERRNYAELERFTKFQGEYARTLEEQKLAMPADGAGYARVADETFEKMWGDYSKDTPPDLLPEYSAKAQDLRQKALISADGFTRDATRGNSLITVNQAIEDARMAVYRDPSVSLDDAIAERIMAAPGISALERRGLILDAQTAVRGAQFGGTVRNGRQALWSAPFSRDVAERIIPAIIQQESAGNARAVSRKGALGLMQVMPATAGDIAREIGDTAFLAMSASEREEYLKDPDVSLRYGSYYFNQQLQTFGGDVELALVAYNAGPGKAQEYQRSGRNPNVLAEETRDYVKKISANIGGLTSDMAFDPQYNLTLDQALAAEADIEQINAQAQRDAANWISTQQQAATAQHNATLQGIYAATRAGQNGPELYLKAVQSGDLPGGYTDSEFNRLDEIYRSVNKVQLETQAAVENFTAGRPMTGPQQELLFSQETLQAVRKRDPAAMGQVIETVARMGSVPKNVENTVEQMIYSSNIQDVSAGSQLLKAMEDRAPSVIATMNQETVARASEFVKLNEADLPQDVIQGYMEQTRTPEGRKALDELKKVDEAYAENAIIDVAEFQNLGAWDGLFTREPTLSMQPSVYPLLQSQYRALYDAAYAISRDADSAKQTALEQLPKTWGVTDVGGGNMLMWLPPEIGLQRYVEQQGLGEQEIRQLRPEFIARSFDNQLRQNFPTVENFRIHSTKDTERALKMGEPVPYIVIPVDEDGEPAINPLDPAHMQLLTQPVYYSYAQATRALRNADERLRDLQTEFEGLTPEEAASPRGARIQQEMRELNRGLRQ